MPKKTRSQPKIVLASSSIYRQKQLAQLGIAFSCYSPDINETALKNEKPQDIALRLSMQKAQVTAEELIKQGETRNNQQNTHPSLLIIGSDQTAAIDGKLLCKPLTIENASNQLKACSNKSVTFHSGIAVYDTGTQTTHSTTVATEVKFRELQEDEIRNYIKADDPLYCAGSFKCECLGIALFDYIRSDDPSALTGLPLIALNKILLQLGFNLLFNQTAN